MVRDGVGHNEAGKVICKSTSLKTTLWTFRCCAYALCECVCVCVPLRTNCDPTKKMTTTHSCISLPTDSLVNSCMCSFITNSFELWTAQNHPREISRNFTFQINISKFLFRLGIWCCRSVNMRPDCISYFGKAIRNQPGTRLQHPNHPTMAGGCYIPRYALPSSSQYEQSGQPNMPAAWDKKMYQPFLAQLSLDWFKGRFIQI